MPIITHVETQGFNTVLERIRGHKISMSDSNRTDAAVAGAELAMELLIDDMVQGKHGIQWWNLPNRSSSPSETPAFQTGEMADEMQVIPNVEGAGTAALDATSRQAWFMEFGFTTRGASGVSFHIRPWMRPGIVKHREDIRAVMLKAMQK